MDDDPQTLRYVRDALSNTGYDVAAAGGPGEALRLVEEEEPTWSCWTWCCPDPTAWN